MQAAQVQVQVSEVSGGISNVNNVNSSDETQLESK